MSASKRTTETTTSLQNPDPNQVKEQPIVIKQELISENDPADPLLSIFKAEEPEVQWTSSITDESTAFCALCMRECTQKLMIHFSKNQETTKQKLEQTIGIRLPLDNCQVCRTCWKLMEIFADFKESCLKATRSMVRLPTGLKCDEGEDSWLSSHRLEVLERTHKILQDHSNSLNFIHGSREAEEENSNSATKNDKKRKTPLKAKTSKSKPKTKMVKPKVVTKLNDSHNKKANKGSTDKPVQSSISSLSSADATEALEIDNHRVVIFTCQTCGRKIDGKVAFDRHTCFAGIQSRDYHCCSICSATFLTTKMLKYHVNKHKGVKPFKCRKFCSNTFYSSSVRSKHERLHCSGEERYICPICSAVLKNQASLKRHIDETHGPKTHPCEVCGQLYTTTRRLQDHMRAHSEVRKFPCEVCDKAFKTRREVRLHMRVHTKSDTR